ncbi:MAG: hypothetical protein P4N41_06395 [Negativicutes bacterium]|nr:hypothetical protein [Negativicutes bacterium]
MREVANKEVRIALIGYNHYEVAEAMGIAEFTFCRWLRRELPPEKKALIIAAIEKLGNGGDGQCSSD